MKAQFCAESCGFQTPQYFNKTDTHVIPKPLEKDSKSSEAFSEGWQNCSVTLTKDGPVFGEGNQLDKNCLVASLHRDGFVQNRMPNDWPKHADEVLLSLQRCLEDQTELSPNGVISLVHSVAGWKWRFLLV